MSWLLGLFNGIWGYVAAAGAALVAVLAVYRSGKSAGATEVVAKTKETEVENVRTAVKIEHDVATRKPSDVQQRLRDKYSRD